MGFFSKLFGGQTAEPASPARVSRDGVAIIESTDTFRITGRGLVVTGRMTTPAVTDEWFEVDYQGKRERLRLSRISIDDNPVPTVEPGATVALLLVNASSDWSGVFNI